MPFYVKQGWRYAPAELISAEAEVLQAVELGQLGGYRPAQSVGAEVETLQTAEVAQLGRN